MKDEVKVKLLREAFTEMMFAAQNKDAMADIKFANLFNAVKSNEEYFLALAQDKLGKLATAEQNQQEAATKREADKTELETEMAKLSQNVAE